MWIHVKKLAVGFLVFLMLTVNANAQTNNWSTQGSSGCSDQFGSFDAYIPGMRGHGSCTRGGFVPGTNVIVVTNRNATGAGSLDAAGEAACPKVILFGVSGLINRGGQVDSDCNNWSIVGASAPGQITLTGATGSSLFATERSNDFTIDHLTFAAGDTQIQGGGLGNRDSISIGTGGAQSGNGVLLNNNFIWGADETIQCYPPVGSESSNVLYWQNIIGKPVGGSGVHILQNTCRNHASIRNFYIHANGRHPLIRGDGYFHANNFTANPGYETINVQTCGGSSSTPDPSTRMNFINNVMARGRNTGGANTHNELKDGTGCTNFSMYETGSYTMNMNFGMENCDNHNCVVGVSPGEFASSQITAVYPNGYVPELIVNTQQGYVDHATKITTFAGANPTNRLAFFQTTVNEGLNHVDGSGDRGGWNAAGGYSLSPVDSTSQQGGLSAITPVSSNYDPTNGAENPCGEDMPAGATADAIQSSGLTRLHEWVIGCFYDNAMPAGYREDRLQNYSAPSGGPPPPRPNPPSGLT